MYRSLLQIFISALSRKTFRYGILSCPPYWIFLDMHDKSPGGHAVIFCNNRSLYVPNSQAVDKLVHKFVDDSLATKLSTSFYKFEGLSVETSNSVLLPR